MSMPRVALKTSRKSPSIRTKMSSLWIKEASTSVCPGIFVPEALGDLEISFDAANHHELLVLLRRLRQRIKMTPAQPARHKKFASALRSAFREHRRFNLQKALAVKVIAGHLRQ